MSARMDYLEKLLGFHEQYEPYQKVNAEYWKLKKAEEKKTENLLDSLERVRQRNIRESIRRNSILTRSIAIRLRA